MRRLLWCGTGVALAGGIGLYVLAAYAACRPHSPVGRQAAAILGFAERMSPLHLPQIEPGFEGPTEAITDAGCARPSVAPGAEGLRNADMMNFIHSYPSAVHIDGDIRNPPPPLVLEGGTFSADAGEEEKPGDAPLLMPPCAADDAPATMPYAHRYADEETPPAGFLEIRPRKPEPATTSPDGLSEESGIPFDRDLANCQEDPNYRYQYPGCPYTGPAPAGRTSSRGSDPHSLKKGSAPDADPPRLKSKVPSFGGGEEEDEPGQHADVDTMEFRPSDARNGEFRKRIQ